MKILKFVSILFVLTCVTSIMNVKADSTLTILAVKLPILSDNYTSSSVTKTTFSDQYVMSHGAVDDLSGDGRAVKARIKNISNTYTTLTRNSYTKLFAGNTNLGQAPGTYQLQVASVKSLVTTATWSGTWILDDYILG